MNGEQCPDVSSSLPSPSAHSSSSGAWRRWRTCLVAAVEDALSMRAQCLPASIAAGTAVGHSSEAVRGVSGAGCSVVESAQHESASL